MGSRLFDGWVRGGLVWGLGWRRCFGDVAVQRLYGIFVRVYEIVCAMRNWFSDQLGIFFWVYWIAGGRDVALQRLLHSCLRCEIVLMTDWVILSRSLDCRGIMRGKCALKSRY